MFDQAKRIELEVKAYALTKREQQVANLAGGGFSNKIIANELGRNRPVKAAG